MSRSLYRQRVTPVRIELGKNEQVALFRRYKMCKKVSYLSKVDLASVPEEYFPTHLRRRSERNLVLSKCQFSRRICLSGAQNFEPTHWTNFVAKLEKPFLKFLFRQRVPFKSLSLHLPVWDRNFCVGDSLLDGSQKWSTLINCKTARDIWPVITQMSTLKRFPGSKNWQKYVSSMARSFLFLIKRRASCRKIKNGTKIFWKSRRFKAATDPSIFLFFIIL